MGSGEGTPISVSVNFVVEDGTGLSNANAYCTVTEADQYHVDQGDPTTWSNAIQSAREDAIRQATQAIDLGFSWKGIRVNSTMSLRWPRWGVEDDDFYVVDSTSVPQRVKEAAAYLALKVINGDVLLPDHQDEGEVKRKKEVLGPLTEETEYFSPNSPNKEYQKVEAMLSPFVLHEGMSVSVRRA